MATDVNMDCRYSGFVDEPTNEPWNEASGYELLHQMAMSTIWTATVDGRRRVYKSLSEAVAPNPVYHRLLRKEYGIMSRLSHPGVVASIRLGKFAGIGEAIEMEWIDGVTLDRWLADNPDRAARRRVMHQMLDAVGYIHSKGVVHRDLKPSNIMVTHDGEFVKLIDFGLADSRSHTELKNPAGTDEYMSERQKEAYEPSGADDLFALRRITGEVFPDLQKWAMRQSDIPDAATFGRKLDRRLSRGRRLTIVVAIAAAIGLIAAVAVIAFSAMQSRQRAELERQASDLRGQIAASESAHQANIALLNDSLARLTAKAAADRRLTDSLTTESKRLNEVIDSEVRQKQKVESIIARLSGKIAKIWATPVSDVPSFEDEINTKVYYTNKLIQEYLKSNPDGLSAAELAAIETALDNKASQLCDNEYKRQR